MYNTETILTAAVCFIKLYTVSDKWHIQPCFTEMFKTYMEKAILQAEAKWRREEQEK
jgi:hypothetical protein